MSLCFTLLFSSLSYSSKIEVFVSILPQQSLVEKIGGDYVHVNVMVKPGQSPETFEPSPKIMSIYSKSDIFFTIGLPFEQVWIKRVASLNDDILVVNTQQSLENIMGDQLLESKHAHSHGDEHKFDPHTWLSPKLYLAQARIIVQNLSLKIPDKKEHFVSNYNELEYKVNALDESFSNLFELNPKKNFVIFHPALSYFAHHYGLNQVSIEIEGKEPSARQIAKIVNRIKDEKVAYILIEKQFNQVIPKTIAHSVGAQLLMVDPLALDYLTNMRDIAVKINQALF